MQIIESSIKKLFNFGKSGKITGYIHDTNEELGNVNDNLPCMIVVPGGSYFFVSNRECEPVAVEFYNRLYNTFTLNYDVSSESNYPVQLLQLACLIHHIRENASIYRINPDKIFVVGFSAGGHLTANLAVSFKDINDIAKDYGLPKLNSKPNGVILSYPVTSPQSHKNSFENLLGKNYSSDEAEKLNLTKFVTKEHPPCFIWGTTTDDGVSPNEMLAYANAVITAGAICECHFYYGGGHGLSLADERTATVSSSIVRAVSNWVSEADRFIKALV